VMASEEYNARARLEYGNGSASVGIVCKQTRMGSIGIEFTEWTPDGHLRHSKFVGLREDKEAKEVVREV
jgi:ATP-dependent DNA ligase